MVQVEFAAHTSALQRAACAPDADAAPKGGASARTVRSAARGEAVLVTGASSGIGRAVATRLARAGYLVFAGVRSDAARTELAAIDTGPGALSPLILDVTDVDTIARAAEEVALGLGGSVFVGVINNAGIAEGGPLLHQSLDAIRRHFEVNVLGGLAVTRAFAELLKPLGALRPGRARIINVSSVAGKIGMPFVGAYAASKHGLEGLSASLRRELLIFGIDVIVVGPGLVATPIWDKSAAADLGYLADTPYAAHAQRLSDGFAAAGRAGMSPQAVAETIQLALEAKRPRVRYAPVSQAVFNWFLPRWLPARLVDRIVARQLGLAPSSASSKVER